MIKAFDIYNENMVDDSPFLFICDHASNKLPCANEAFIDDLDALGRHIAWDIGARDVTCHLADKLKAPAILANFSRLYIDLNRPTDDFTCMRPISDGVVIKGNININDDEKKQRIDNIFTPYHDKISDIASRMDRYQPTLKIIFIHSFTPVFKGVRRPWSLGVLTNQDARLGHQFLKIWHEKYPDILIGDNQPYSGHDEYSYSIMRHGFDSGRLHFALEIRQDLINNPKNATEWGDKIANICHSME